jgi:hypothetical protein
MGIVVKRQVSLEQKVPWVDGDEHKKEIEDILTTQQKIIREHEGEIEKHKKPLKTALETQGKAMDELTDGKPTQVKCLLLIDHEKNIVKTQRLDTKEWLPEHPITDNEKDPQLGDEEVKEAS